MFDAMSSPLYASFVQARSGSGFIINIIGYGPSDTFTVKYNEPLGGTTKRNIGYDRLTILLAFFASNIRSRPKRKRVVLLPL